MPPIARAGDRRDTALVKRRCRARQRPVLIALKGDDADNALRQPGRCADALGKASVDHLGLGERHHYTAPLALGSTRLAFAQAFRSVPR